MSFHPKIIEMFNRFLACSSPDKEKEVREQMSRGDMTVLAAFAAGVREGAFIYRTKSSDARTAVFREIQDILQ